MSAYLTEHQADLEDTVELPVLSELAILDLSPDLTGDAADELATTVESLEAAVARAESQWREVEAQLGARHGETGTSADLAAADLDRKTLAERVAALESYIAGRADHWREMQTELDARARRITELETELGQRIERENRLEQCLRDQDGKSRRLRSRLRLLNLRLVAGTASHKEPGEASAPPAPRAEVSSLSAVSRQAAGVPALICLDSGLRVRFPLLRPRMTIGRAPDCDIQIATDVVSRHHASLRFDQHGASIEDHSSVNGVFVNGARVERARLAGGDEIRIGETRFRFEPGAPP